MAVNATPSAPILPRYMPGPLKGRPRSPHVDRDDARQGRRYSELANIAPAAVPTESPDGASARYLMSDSPANEEFADAVAETHMCCCRPSASHRISGCHRPDPRASPSSHQSRLQQPSYHDGSLATAPTVPWPTGTRASGPSRVGAPVLPAAPASEPQYGSSVVGQGTPCCRQNSIAPAPTSRNVL